MKKVVAYLIVVLFVMLVVASCSSNRPACPAYKTSQNVTSVANDLA